MPLSPVGLYEHAFPATRSGPLYNAFSYPTKIDPEAVAVFLAAHTDVGGTVLDPFGGSCSTAIAASLCDRPTKRMCDLAAAAGVNPVWGPRKAIVYELSPVGSLAGRVLTDPPDPHSFEAAAKRLISLASGEVGWMYDALDLSGGPGRIRHVIWSEILLSSCCGQRLSLWEAAAHVDPARLEPVRLAKDFICPACNARVMVSDCQREVRRRDDPITGEVVDQRTWVPAQVYGQTGNATWCRPPTEADLALIDRADSLDLRGRVPDGRIKFGDLYRSGYHTGITHFHHLYTRRNLSVLAALWEAIPTDDPRMADALRLLVLSYTATHSTLMTRVVVKKNQTDFVLTGAQSGVLYVSGLPVEKNIIAGIERKLSTFVRAFAMTYGSRSDVRVVTGSSTRLDLPDSSVDYLFTDPPFGDFIPYAEVNQVNEAWLGSFTDRAEEAIISPAQDKDASAYAELMTRVFRETARALRPGSAATVVFHGSTPVIWSALGRALSESGYRVQRTSVLDKVQLSFKQVVHEGGTRDDALFLLSLDEGTPCSPLSNDINDIINVLERQAGGDSAEFEPKRLFSRYGAWCLEHGVPMVFTSREFYAHLAQRRGDL